MNVPMFWRASRLLAAKLRDACRGNVAIEFAFIVPALLLLIGGLIEYGVVTYDATSLENAARAGAQFAFSGGYSAAKVEQAVRDASAVSLGPDDIVSSHVFCECTDGTPIACGDTCSNGGPNRRFISVSVTMQHHTTLPFLASIVPSTVRGNATIRMQ